MFWVYFLKNPAGNFYIGYTDNLENRILSHNRTDKISWQIYAQNGPWALVWFEELQDRSSACDASAKLRIWKSARLIRDRLVNTKALAQW